MRTTHAVEFMYSNIKYKQTNTYTFFLNTQSHQSIQQGVQYSLMDYRILPFSFIFKDGNLINC